MTDVPAIRGYHAHVYYDRTTRKIAHWLREELHRSFSVHLGHWRDEPVGPHPQSMYQVKFERDIFSEIVPWLTLHHQGLSILIHPCTDQDLLDHTEFALWIGEQIRLRVEAFDR